MICIGSVLYLVYISGLVNHLHVHSEREADGTNVEFLSVQLTQEVLYVVHAVGRLIELEGFVKGVISDCV